MLNHNKLLNDIKYTLKKVLLENDNVDDNTVDFIDIFTHLKSYLDPDVPNTLDPTKANDLMIAYPKLFYFVFDLYIKNGTWEVYDYDMNVRGDSWIAGIIQLNKNANILNESFFDDIEDDLNNDIQNNIIDNFNNLSEKYCKKRVLSIIQNTTEEFDTTFNILLNCEYTYHINSYGRPATYWDPPEDPDIESHIEYDVTHITFNDDEPNDEQNLLNHIDIFPNLSLYIKKKLETQTKFNIDDYLEDLDIEALDSSEY